MTSSVAEVQIREKQLELRSARWHELLINIHLNEKNGLGLFFNFIFFKWNTGSISRMSLKLCFASLKIIINFQKCIFCHF